MSILNNFETINLRDYNEVVSLGMCCETTFAIRKYGLSKKSYPFDWLAFYNPKHILETIENNFSEYFDISMEYNPMTNLEQLTNKKYNFVIPHHSNENFEIKFTKKIENFRNLDKHIKKLFILKTHCYNKISNEDILKLLSILRDKFKNFDLFIVREYEISEQEISGKEILEINTIENLFISHIIGQNITCAFDKHECYNYWDKFFYTFGHLKRRFSFKKAKV